MQASGRSGWVIGRAVGAPIVLNPGWLVATVVLGVVIAPSAGTLPGMRGAGSLLVGLAVALLLNSSVLLHELAHAVAARLRGLAVRQITLTLTGGHTEMSNATSPGTSALVAIAGPVANLALAAVAWWAWLASEPGQVVGHLLLVLAWASAFVAAFNLLPGLPMDGGWVLEALVWRVVGRRTAGTRAAAWVGRVVAVGLVVWAVAVPLLGRGGASLPLVVWSALIGAMLWSGASAHLRQAATADVVDALAVSDLARPVATAPDDATVADVADKAGAGAGDREVPVLLVAPDGAPVGVVDPAALAAVPVPDRAGTAAVSVVVPLPPGAVVDGRLTGRDALAELARATRISRVLAVRDADGRVVGLVRYEDVAAALRPRG